MAAKNLKLSLVIPVYNEEKILASTLNKARDFLKNKKYSWEILVSDDGSGDRSVDIALGFKNKGVRTVKLPQNRGKGAALRNGVLSAKGDFIIFTDCDLSVPINYIDNMLLHLEKKYDVVIGSRRTKGAKIKVHQPKLRETMGRFYTFLTKSVLNMFFISDFTCGFKGFTRVSGHKIFSRSLVNRWAYDSEILFLAKILGYQIKEIPVEWRNREDTRVVLRKVILESFRDLLMVRLNWITGKYKK